MSSHCYTCGVATAGDSVCVVCGAPKQGGGPGGFLPLIGWLLIPFSIPVYPVMGGLATLAMVAVGYILQAMDVSDGIRILGIAVTGYLAVLVTYKLEKRVSQLKAYRVFRWIMRCAAGIVIAGVAIEASGTDLSPANALFIAVIGVPLLLVIAWQFDRVLGVRPLATVPAVTDAANISGDAAYGTGSPDEEPAPAKQSLWRGLNWPDAIGFGLLPGIIGFAIGREGGLFLGAFFWLATVAIIIGLQVIGRFFGLAGGVSARLGGMPMAMLKGVAFGAIAGAVIGKIQDGRVQIEAVIIGAVMGVIIAIVINRMRRRRAVNPE